MKKQILFLFLVICLTTLVRADSLTFEIKFIVPSEGPTFDNLRNFTHPVNTGFLEDFDATDIDGISCFTLNDTSTFNIDCNGTITNVTSLTNITIYYLNVTVNDTLNYNTTGSFYISIVNPILPSSPIFVYPDLNNTIAHIFLGRRLNLG